MFTSDDTKRIKGVAITLMLMYHLWIFPDRLPMDFQLQPFGFIIAGIDLQHLLGHFGQICVSLYAFLGDYGLWKKIKSGNPYSLVDDIIRLYKELWKVALIFLPIGICFFQTQPDYAKETAVCHIFTGSRVLKILQSLSGLGYPYNLEWWFFATYLGALILGYLFIHFNKNHDLWTDVFIVVLIQIVSQKLFPMMYGNLAFDLLLTDFFAKIFVTINICVCSFFMGIVFAKYDVLNRLHVRFCAIFRTKALRLAGSAAGIGILILCRFFCYGLDGDLIYVPFLVVFLLEWINLLPATQKIFWVLGKYSTGMWLIHTFYCYYFYDTARLVCYTQNAWISLLTLIAMSLLSAVAVEYFWKCVSCVYKKWDARYKL